MNRRESLITALLVVMTVAVWIALLFPGTVIGLVGSAVAGACVGIAVFIAAQGGRIAMNDTESLILALMVVVVGVAVWIALLFI